MLSQLNCVAEPIYRPLLQFQGRKPNALQYFRSCTLLEGKVRPTLFNEQRLCFRPKFEGKDGLQPAPRLLAECHAMHAASSRMVAAGGLLGQFFLLSLR